MLVKDICWFSAVGLCLEKRVFYRLISGLHSSINIHLCAENLLDGECQRNNSADVSTVFNNKLLSECLYDDEKLYIEIRVSKILLMYIKGF